jgi:type II secretory pathway predicted ATPase ExeA
MYNEHFGFRSTPFSVTPDSDVYYATAASEEAFASVKHAVTQKKGLVVITGEIGTGKTTLLHRLLRQLGPEIHSAFIFNTQLTFDDLLRLALEDFGLHTPAEDRVSRIAVLNRYLADRLKENESGCLVVDEAQNLSIEALGQLRLLLNAETPNQKLLQIVLAGQPELERKLDQPSVRELKQRVFSYARLRPLKASEIAAYIGCRLEAAGYEGKSLFSREALQRLALYSGGVPRLINIICDNALISGYALGQHEISADIIEEVAADLRLVDSNVPNVGRERARDFPAEQLRIPEDITSKTFPRDGAGPGSYPLPLSEFAPTRDWQTRTERQAGFKTAALLTALLFGGAGALIYSHTARRYFSGAGSTLEELVSHFANSKSEGPAEQNAIAPAPRVESSAEPTNSGAAYEAPSGSESPEAQPTEVRLTPKNPPVEHREKHPTPDGLTRSRLPVETALESRNPEFAIQKAIQNRGIAGVSASFVNGTAFLEGAVATDRQKEMAERAARSVPGVKVVRNRIDVK